jgi:hypothetical protein
MVVFLLVCIVLLLVAIVAPGLVQAGVSILIVGAGLAILAALFGNWVWYAFVALIVGAALVGWFSKELGIE